MPVCIHKRARDRGRGKRRAGRVGQGGGRGGEGEGREGEGREGEGREASVGVPEAVEVLCVCICA